MATLGAGALVVMHLGYFSYQLFDALTERYVYWVSRLRAKTSLIVVATLADRPVYRDRIVYLGTWAAGRAAHLVRCVEPEVDGKSYAWLTNVLDPRMMSATACGRSTVSGGRSRWRSRRSNARWA